MTHTVSHKQKETSFFSIRNKMITSFAVFAVSILTIIYIVAIYFASVSLLNNTEYFLKELVKSSSKVLDERSQALFGKLEAFSNLPLIQDDTVSYQEKIELFKNEIQMQKQRGWLSFGISGLDGMLYRTDNTVEKVASADWFQSARKGKYIITEPAQSSTDRRYIFIVAIPMRDLQGKITGVINATILGDALSNLISDIIVGETGTAYLVSASGTVLGNRRPEILYKSIYSEIIGSDTNAYAQFLKQALASHKSSVNVSEIKGVKYISAVASMRYADWTLLLTAPVSEFMAENVTNLIKTFVIIALCQLIIAISLGVLIARNITRPINHVIDALKNIAQGEGDLTIELPASGKDETSVLSSYFNQTILKLKNSIQKVGADSREMESVGSDLESNMMSVSEVVSNITAGIEDLKKRFVEQEESVSGTAAAIEHIIKTLRGLDESIGQQAAMITESSTSFDKMSPFVREAMVDELTTRRLTRSVGDQRILTAFVRINGDAEKVLHRYGCRELARVGDISIAAIPLDRLGELSLCKQVTKEEFLIFKSFVAYVVINDLSIEQIFDLEKILKNKMFCEKLLYANRDFKIGNIYKVEDLKQDSNVFAALLVAKIILVSDTQP